MQKILIALFLSLTIISCSERKSNGDGDEANDCYQEISFMNQIKNKCNNTVNVEYIEEYMDYCILISDTHTESYWTCSEKLNKMYETCEGVDNIKTIDDLKAIEGCLDLPLKTKKEACIENQNSYCRNIYYSCGEEKIPAVCAGYETYGSSESHEIKFDESKLAKYCATTENGTQEITNTDDLFAATCNIQYDCANLPDLNFKNDSWKTSCVE